MADVLGTTSNPAGGTSGLPGIQPGDATAGPAGVVLNKLTEQFQRGITGPLGGGEEGGGMDPSKAIGVAMKIAPLLL
jgi:hypothetical protein